MTVIAYDGRILAADNQTTVHDQPMLSQKIHRVKGGPYDGYWLACSGRAAGAPMLLAWLEEGALRDKVPAVHTSMDVIGLMVHPTREPLSLQGEAIPRPIANPFYSIGSGSLQANSALALGKNARKSVEHACSLNIYCGLGVDWVDLSAKQPKIKTILF